MPSKLQDFEVNIRVKLAALWTSVTLFYIYGDYFELYVPGKVQGLVSGVNMLDSPMKLFYASLLLAIPSSMIALSILLNQRLSRGLNIATGLLMTVVTTLVGISSIGSWATFSYVFYAAAESIITSVIVWYAWNWPRQADTIG